MSHCPPFIARSPQQLMMRNVFVELLDLCSVPVMLKYEGFNAAGSIKLKSAVCLLDHLEMRGELLPGREIIESSSGNLGIALSIVCAARGYKFTCVTDPASTENSRLAIRATGARLIIVDQRDENGGYLMTRLKTIEKMCRENPKLIWTNQYANQSNSYAHYSTTAPEILDAFPKVDWLFVGAGTTGTLMGCIHYFNEHSRMTKIVAVDAQGSITFGGKKGRRLIPGLGTSRVPPLCDHSAIKRVHVVDEISTLGECRYWAKRGYLFGGSTGTVLAAIRAFASEIAADDVVVAISPDGGEKYLSTVHNPHWVNEHFPKLPEEEEVEYQEAGYEV
jgi:2,3-diaminopropionate biosynthesis protein SbnA